MEYQNLQASYSGEYIRNHLIYYIYFIKAYNCSFIMISLFTLYCNFFIWFMLFFLLNIFIIFYGIKKIHFLLANIKKKQ